MKYGVWGLVLLLMVLHHDLWFWENETLVAGIVPMGLFYHVCISLGAGFTWFLATQFAWPLDQTADSQQQDGGAA